MLLCVSGGVAVADPAGAEAAEPKTQPILLYSNSIEGDSQGGDIEHLRAAMREGVRIGVNWGTWHGRVSTDCREIREEADETFVCVAEVWCHESSGDVPTEHGHRSRIYSTGDVSTLIMTVRSDQQHTIFGVGRGRSNVDWYRYGPAPEGSASPAVASR